MPKKKKKLTDEEKTALRTRRALAKRNRQRQMARAKEMNPPKHYRIMDDPKKQAFLKAYYDPSSETYSNAYRSGLVAGYSESYSRSIRQPGIRNKWIDINNYTDRHDMSPEHIISSYQRLALRSPKEETQLKALEMLAKIKGMLVDKKIIATTTIEDILNDIELPSNSDTSDTDNKTIIDIDATD